MFRCRLNNIFPQLIPTYTFAGGWATSSPLTVIEFKFNLFALFWWRAENTGAMEEPPAALPTNPKPFL